MAPPCAQPCDGTQPATQPCAQPCVTHPGAQPCVVCGENSASQCKCGRRYCGRECQKRDWPQHRPLCKRKAAETTLEDDAENDKEQAVTEERPGSRGTCAICLELLPIQGDETTHHTCCCQSFCSLCIQKADALGDRLCPLCRAPHPKGGEELSRLRAHVDKGNAEAQFMLAGWYRFGNSLLEQNDELGAHYYALAAKQGHVGATSKLGNCYSSGSGVELDKEKAAQYFKLAAEQGDCMGQLNLAICYREGTGVPQSHSLSFKWNELAAEQGLPIAQFFHARHYQHGRGVSKNEEEALRLYKLAANGGYHRAHADIATLQGA